VSTSVMYIVGNLSIDYSFVKDKPNLTHEVDSMINGRAAGIVESLHILVCMHVQSTLICPHSFFNGVAGWQAS
jgi:hypothetical protein